MKTRLLVFVACLAITLAACSTKSRPLTELAPPTTTADYVVHSGDTLNISVWGEPNVSGEAFVREDGKFALKLPGTQDVAADGKTPQQIAESVTKELEKFVPAASVKISVIQTSPIRFFLSGQFAKPGEFRSDKKITLLQAIATGGGFAPFADESEITLIRRGTGTESELRYTLDYNRIIQGQDPNPELKDGDVIAVQ